MLLGELERLDEALLEFDKAIEMNPNYNESNLSKGNVVVLIKGMVSKQLGRLEQALLYMIKPFN